MDVIDVILADKNEDIEHLQHTVTLLQNQVDDQVPQLWFLILEKKWKFY